MPKIHWAGYLLFIIKFYLTMKKSFIIAAFAALAFTACNNSEKSSSDNLNPEQELTAPAVNQDSIDKAHGHSHDPAGNHLSADSTDKSVAQPKVNQDSIDNAHGHKH